MPLIAGRATARAIRKEASRLFFQRGYAATSLREVARAVDLNVGSLYNHIDSKEDLLQQVMGGIMTDLLALQKEALKVQGDAVDRLLAALDCHLRFHARHAQEVFIGNNELRSLPFDARAELMAKRHQYEKNIEKLIVEAGTEGLAEVLDPRLHTFSWLAQATHIARWYQPEGRLSLDEIVRIYTKLALRELKIVDGDGRVDRRA